jgi:hypothetical protein
MHHRVHTADVSAHGSSMLASRLGEDIEGPGIGHPHHPTIGRVSEQTKHSPSRKRKQVRECKPNSSLEFIL